MVVSVAEELGALDCCVCRLHGEEVRWHDYVRALVEDIGVTDDVQIFVSFVCRDLYAYPRSRDSKSPQEAFRLHRNEAAQQQHQRQHTNTSPYCVPCIPVSAPWLFFFLRRPISALL